MCLSKFSAGIVAVICFACFGLDFARHGFETSQLAFIALGILGPIAFIKQAQYHKRRQARLSHD